MKTLLKNIIVKLFIAFMAVQIINLSIDAVEFEPLYASNDVCDFNYMNSMTEYVTEILLHHKDAFPEYQKESPSGKAQLVKHISLKIIFENKFTPVNNHSNICFNYGKPFNDNNLSSYIQEINPPPPKSKTI